MKTLAPRLFQFLGYVTNGDFGNYTCYTSYHKHLVMFPKTWPKDPATYHQTLYRNRWRHAAARWNHLDQATRDLWKTIGFRANLTISGHNLFIFYILGNHDEYIHTIQRNTGLDVITPTGPPLPYLTR